MKIIKTQRNSMMAHQPDKSLKESRSSIFSYKYANP